MKYLKLFEGYDSYYIEIDERRFSDLVNDVDIEDSFSKEDLELISKIKSVSSQPYDWNTTKFWGFRINFNLNLYIYKFKDEYYIVEIHYMRETIAKYFQCDQIEGLKKCLEDNKFL